MTAETLAAAILRDVPRWTKINDWEVVGSPLLDEHAVLAALSRAMSDDLAERAVLTVLRLRSGLDNADRGAEGERELGGVVLTMNDAADLITALLTANAALRAERDRFEAALGRACLVGGTTYLVERAQKAEARAERLEAALREIKTCTTEHGGAAKALRIIRTALKENSYD